MRLVTVIALGGLLVAMSTAANAETPPARARYISDYPGLVIHSHQAYGQLGIDVAAHSPGAQPLPLQIHETHYTKGLGHHADGEIVLQLDGQYSSFRSDIGVQWQGGKVGSVIFQVYVDDEKRFDSGVMRESDAPRPVEVSLTGAQELRLVATSAGDGIICDCANWAEARLLLSETPTLTLPQEPFDVAPFARVVTWDSQRMVGARASRIEEFHADDLFLETRLAPNSDCSYTVPSTPGKGGCIGLQWLERRRLTQLAVDFGANRDKRSCEGVQVQGWVGESPWQGEWRALRGTIAHEPNRWTFPVDYILNPEIRSGLRKVRWVFPASDEPIVVERLHAYTAARCDTLAVSIFAENPAAGSRCEIEVYNGTITDSAGSSARRVWDMDKPATISVRYCRPRVWEADRTVIRLKMQNGSFGVAIDDVINNESVYVKSAGIYIAKEPLKTRLYDYLRNNSRRETILSRVRKLPDQTLQQAMAKTHNPVQDNGPMMLSLACDNHKFVVLRDGTIHFPADPDAVEQDLTLTRNWLLSPSFGTGAAPVLKRQLDGNWLPVPVISCETDGISYSQRTCVVPKGKATTDPTAWLNGKPLCVAEYTLENKSSNVSTASLALRFSSVGIDRSSVAISALGPGWAVLSGNRILVWIDTSGCNQLKVDAESNTVILSGPVEPGSKLRCMASIPAWRVSRDDYAQFAGGERTLARVSSYWTRALAPAMQISVPDPLLMDVIRASQVHCLMAARNEEQAKRVAPWIASLSYGPLESESNSIIRGMCLMGHEEFARRSLDYFIHRYNPAGFLTTGYTLMGTGWHLQALGEFHQITQDRAWMKRVAPQVTKVCQWIAAQSQKTKRLDPLDRKPPEYGLMPPGVIADWNAFAYYFSLNGYYYAGLKGAAEALADIAEPGSRELLTGAEAFRQDILTAYEWTQARMPVVPLKDGTWVCGYPSQVHVPGRTNDFFPGEDGNRSWAYDVELGAHQLVPQGVLSPDSPRVADMMDHMEDVQFLASGWFDYPAEASEKDWFNLGGFAKVQPYYCRNAEIYAMRDDVKPFLRTYFNSLASLLNTENLSLWEHFRNGGAWNKTHETGYFLQQTRLMLLMEKGSELWLAPFVTNTWMKDAMTVSVSNAPTRFGKASYTITSHVADGYIEATVDPPTRSQPAEIVLRLRHPEGKQITSVTVDGVSHSAFDPAKEIVRLKPGTQTMLVRANYR